MSFETYLMLTLTVVGLIWIIADASQSRDPNIKPFVASNGERFASQWHCMQVNLIIAANDGIPRLYGPRLEEFRQKHGLT